MWGMATLPSTLGTRDRKGIQDVFQLDIADYSLEAEQHQCTHTNAKVLLGRANTVCVQRLRGDRVNNC